MATINIAATRSDTLGGYQLWVDSFVVNGAWHEGPEVKMHGDQGQAEVLGTCGDGSRHRLRFALGGPAGSTLTVALACAGGADIGTTTIEIYPEGEPVAAGTEEFTL
jgi:hypothetical protein